MVKSYLERLPAVLSWTLKIVFFNIVFTGWFMLCKLVFMLDVGMTMGIIAHLAANAFFILADVAFSMMISLYVNKLRKRFKIGRKK